MSPNFTAAGTPAAPSNAYAKIEGPLLAEAVLDALEGPVLKVAMGDGDGEIWIGDPVVNMQTTSTRDPRLGALEKAKTVAQTCGSSARQILAMEQIIVAYIAANPPAVVVTGPCTTRRSNAKRASALAAKASLTACAAALRAAGFPMTEAAIKKALSPSRWGHSVT